MKLATTFVLAAFLVSTLCHADPEFDDTIDSFTGTKKFSFLVTKQMLAKTPSWDGKSDLPFPIGKARERAEAELKKLVENSNTYTLNSISVQYQPPSNRWLFLMQFVNIQKGQMPTPPFSVVVLFDGTVVDPKISDYNLWSPHSDGH